MPIFFTAPSSYLYCTFAANFEALKAPYFLRETVLQYPGYRHTKDNSALVPEEFVAEENINFCKDMSANEQGNTDDKMVKTSNLPSPPQDKDPSKIIQLGPLTFDPSPPLEEGKDI
jgi:hypothetical protein